MPDREGFDALIRMPSWDEAAVHKICAEKLFCSMMKN
jgi:hypothetical protein